jgi:hypothetical protein
MPTYSTRSVPSTSWSGRPTPGAAITYGSAITYEEASIKYDGSGGFSIPTYTTLTHPTTAYTSRVIPY